MQIILFAFVFLIGLLFVEPICDLFDRFVVSPWLSQVQRDIFTDIIVIVLFILFIYLYFKKAIKFSLTIWFLILFICSCLVLKKSFYLYLHFKVFPIAYLWTFVTAAIVSSILDISRYLKNSQIVFSENSNIKVDTLDRISFVSELVKAIMNKNKDLYESKALAILGEWGSGKTFALNQIKDELKKNYSELVVIEFNPWSKNQISTITTSFLDTLGEKLSRSNLELARKIKSYSESFSKSDSSGIGKIFNDFVLHFLPKGIDTTNYEEVNLAIKNNNKDIVVFIDDVDRLLYPEVMEVLKLIRNTANFGKITYVVAFSKSYVVHSIGQYNAYSPNNFLEKIFNAQYVLPPSGKSILFKNLSSIIRSNPSLNLFSDKIIEALTEYRPPNSMLFQDFIQNIRDVERYCELLHTESRELFNSLNIKDLVYVQLIRLKYQHIYSKLFELKEDIFILNSNEGKLPSYRLRTRAELQGNDVAVFDGALRRTVHLVDRNKSEINEDSLVLDDFLAGFPFIRKGDSDLLLSSIKRLLKEESPLGNLSSAKSGTTNAELEFDQDFVDEYKGFQNPEYFPKYFCIESSKYISIESFIQCLNSDEDSLKLTISNWVSVGKGEIIFALTNKYKPRKALNIYNKSTVLILLSNYQITQKGIGIDNFLYELANIISVIVKPRLETLLPPDFEKGHYFQWLQAKSQDFPLVISLLNIRLSDFGLDAPFDRNTLYDINFSIFQNYCLNGGAIDFVFWNLRINSRKVIEGQGEELVSDEAKYLASKYFKENYDQRNLGSLIESNGSTICFDLGENKKIKVIFGTIDEFEEWVFSDYFDSKKIEVNIFRSIFSKLKHNNFSPIYYEKEWRPLFS